MKMNKIKNSIEKNIAFAIFILIIFVGVFFIGQVIGEKIWQNNEPEPKKIELQENHFKFIAELATVEAYYHNVTKVLDEDYEEWLWIDKPLNFWVTSEYVVTYGVDADLIKFDRTRDVISITIPKARVLYIENIPNENKTYVAKDSVDVGNDELKVAYKETQTKITEESNENSVLLEKAQYQAKQLISNYVNKVAYANGSSYEIKWIEVDENGNPIKK